MEVEGKKVAHFFFSSTRSSYIHPDLLVNPPAQIFWTDLRQLGLNFEKTLGQPWDNLRPSIGGAYLCPVGSIWPFQIDDTLITFKGFSFSKFIPQHNFGTSNFAEMTKHCTQPLFLLHFGIGGPPSTKSMTGLSHKSLWGQISTDN